MALPQILKPKRRHVCHALAAMFSFFVVVPISLMAFDRDPPFDLSDGFTIPSELKAGGSYKFNWLMRPIKSRHCSGVVNWQIVDSQGVIWATQSQESLFTAIVKKEPQRVVGRERILPSGVSEGILKFYPSMEFSCNPLHVFFPIKVDFPVVTTRVVK